MSRFRPNVVASGERSIAVGGSLGFVATGDGATVNVGKGGKAERPRVGVSLFVVRNGKFLAGLRLGSHGEGEWGTPGGHNEFGEMYEDTVLRELHEECGDDLTVTAPRFLCVTNLRAYTQTSGRHYTDVAFVSHWTGGEARVMEPKKCAEWRWLDLYGVHSRAFAVVPNLQEAYRTGRPYFA